MIAHFNYQGAKVLVTGGAGFIGSHLVEALLARGARVVVYDDLSSGRKENLSSAAKDRGYSFLEGDVFDKARLGKALADVDGVFHLAANPEVRVGSQQPTVHTRANIEATIAVLEAMRNTACRHLAFTSTSTVYGDASVIPTPEEYGPCNPISIYGASKLASEAIISSYCHSFGFNAVTYRFANVVGARSTHGVTYDFVEKLRNDPTTLEILGNGKQNKSYVHISDCTEAMLVAFETHRGGFDAYNIGSEDRIDVVKIADIVTSEMGLRGVKYAFTGGIDGGRGWVGDVKDMLLSVDKIKKLGWAPKHGSADAIRKATQEQMMTKK